MYAAIRHYRLTGSLDEVVDKVDQEFLPIIGDAPGFISYYVVDSGDGTLTTVSVFTDQEGAERSTELARDWVQENLAQYVEGPPQITSGPVRSHGGQ